MHSVAWYIYPYYDIENLELYNWNIHLEPGRKKIWVLSRPTHRHGHTNSWHVYVFQKEIISIIWNASIIQGMFIMIEWVYGPGPRYAGGNTPSNQYTKLVLLCVRLSWYGLFCYFSNICASTSISNWTCVVCMCVRACVRSRVCMWKHSKNQHLYTRLACFIMWTKCTWHQWDIHGNWVSHIYHINALNQYSNFFSVMFVCMT